MRASMETSRRVFFRAAIFVLCMPLEAISQIFEKTGSGAVLCCVFYGNIFVRRMPVKQGFLSEVAITDGGGRGGSRGDSVPLCSEI